MQPILNLIQYLCFESLFSAIIADSIFPRVCLFGVGALSLSRSLYCLLIMILDLSIMRSKRRCIRVVILMRIRSRKQKELSYIFSAFVKILRLHHFLLEENSELFDRPCIQFLVMQNYPLNNYLLVVHGYYFVVPIFYILIHFLKVLLLHSYRLRKNYFL